MSTLNDQALENTTVSEISVDVSVTAVMSSAAPAADIDVVYRVERASYNDGAASAAAVTAVGAGGARPPVVQAGQLAAGRRVERLELGAAREVEGATADGPEVGQVLLE